MAPWLATLMACSGPEPGSLSAPPQADNGTGAELGALPEPGGQGEGEFTHPAPDAGTEPGSPEVDTGGLLPTPDPSPSDDTLSYSCTPVGQSNSDGFFSLESFRGQLYAGLFGYGREEQSMLLRYPPWQPSSPGLTGIGESVCALRVFDGYLYANTEDSGDIFRSSDGSHWSQVYDGEPGSIGCGLAEFQGSLFAINYRNRDASHGRILRQDGETWTPVYDSGERSLYIREIVAYDGTLYAFAALNGQGQMLSSRDGASWTLEPVANRYFRGHVWHGYLWLGSTDYFAEGEVGVVRFDGEQFVQTYSGRRRYVTDILDLGGKLFAGTSNGWKNETGPSSLIMSPDGESDWQTLCTFEETAVWDLAVFEGELYLGTWDFGGQGAVYRLRIEASPPGQDDPVEDPPEIDAPVDCSLITNARPAWELCEQSPRSCAGVFTDGAGCQAYCAAAGLECVRRFGGEPGCQKEPGFEIPCARDTGHQSDWCECGVPAHLPGPAPTPPPPDRPSPRGQPGSLQIGETYVVGVDAHSGDEGTTEPKHDANHGQQGDNPEFRRHNVARAHNDYWYSSSHQEAGEPDPRGPQWVDYSPDFPGLGVGCYQIVTQYRATENRAPYPAIYRVMNSAVGDVAFEQLQHRGHNEYVDVDLGRHFLEEQSFVRVEDPGSASISFHPMRFRYLGDDCP